MKKKTVWNVFRDFVNTQPIGTFITRQTLISEIRKEMGTRWENMTLDSARNMATSRTGYLSTTDKSGIYKVNKHFNPELSCSGLRKEYENLRDEEAK